MDRITSVYALKEAYQEKHPRGHFFDRDTLRFFGETFSGMNVLNSLATIRDSLGEKHTCYVLSSLQRKHPMGPRRVHHYFDVETLDNVFPGGT